MERHPFFHGMQPQADLSGDCEELIRNALNFHHDVAEVFARFANAAGIDGPPPTEQSALPPAPPRPRAVSASTGTALPENDPILLTPREREVLTLIAQGNSSKQVAYSLGISFKTAVCHRYNIMEKLNIHDVSGLVRFAIRNGLIRP